MKINQKAKQKERTRLLKYIKDDNIDSVKEFLLTYTYDDFDKLFRYACENGENVIKYLLGEFDDFYSSEIDSGLVFLVQKFPKLFLEIHKKFINQKGYKDAEIRFMRIAARFGKEDLFTYFINERGIDPAQPKNELLYSLIRKTKISASGNNIQRMIEILKNDPRVIEEAAKCNQTDLLPDDIKDMFVF